MKNQTDLVKAFHNGATRGTASNMFIRGDVLYSYGEHFPLAVRRTDGVYILNGDRYSVTTSGHQGIVRWELKENVIIPFSVLDSLRTGGGLHVARNMMILDRSNDQYKTVKYLDPKTGEPKEREEHLLGACLFEFDGKFYLSSTDSGAKSWGMGYFLVQLPKKVNIVAQAFDSLKPRGLKEDMLYIRQGEFFFVPEPSIDVEKQAIQKKVDLAERFGNDGGNPHIVTDYAEIKGKPFARKTVRHPEHKMVNLGDVWHRVLINRAVASFNVIGNVD